MDAETEQREAEKLAKKLSQMPLSQRDKDHLSEVLQCIIKIFRGEATFVDYLVTIEPVVKANSFVDELERNTQRYPRFKEVQLSMAKLCLERPDLPTENLYDEAVKLADGEQPCH